VLSLGVSIAHALLIVAQAEAFRTKHGQTSRMAARLAIASRLRPILMTAFAMTAGMIPIALGMGEGGSQVAPLGQAVIGGLVLSTVTSLFVLPHFYAVVRRHAKVHGPSMDPDDPEYISRELQQPIQA